jgi:hypothetical protein
MIHEPAEDVERELLPANDVPEVMKRVLPRTQVFDRDVVASHQLAHFLFCHDTLLTVRFVDDLVRMNPAPRWSHQDDGSNLRERRRNTPAAARISDEEVEVTMQSGLIAAGCLAGLLGVAHSILGERYILIRLFRREDLPRLFGSGWFTRRTLRFAWHLTTIAWWGFAALLVMTARDLEVTRANVLLVIAVTFGASGAVTALASRGRHLAWVVFLAIALLAWLGS